jgi:hypothetical protein
MAKKKPFVLRISSEKLESIEHWAADEFRSTNGQIEWIIDKALKEAGRYKAPKNADLNGPDVNPNLAN